VKTHVLKVKERIEVTNNSSKPIDTLYFHIYPNRKYTRQEQEFMYRLAGYFKVNPYPEGFQSPDLKIEYITKDKQKLSFVIEGKDQTILRVKLPSELSPEETVRIEIDFKLDIPHSYGRLGWHKDIIALARWYPMLSVLDEEGWHNYPFYPYHQPFFSDAAYYKVNLTLPQDQTVVHTGYLKDSFITQDGRRTLIIETDFPVRDFSFAVSSHYKKYSLIYNNTEINSYYLADDEFYGKKAAEFARELMQNYTESFGRYPYKEFNIVPVYLGYGGGQSSNLIFIDTRVYKLPRFLIRYFDFLISHETGHQWFYNIVGSDEYKQMWIDEGINSFFILSYLEKKYKDGQVMVLPDWLSWLLPNFSFRQATTDRYIFLAKRGLDIPVLSKLSSFGEPTNIFSLTYGKGAAIVSMLKGVMGKEAFDRIMKRYFDEFSFRNIKVKDLARISQEESGQDLNWFFNQWLATDKICDYAVRDVSLDEVVVERRGRIRMPIETDIEYSDGDREIDSWDGRGEFRKIKIKDKKLIKRIKIDPQGELLDIDKTNNIWPRSLYIRAVPLYLSVYEVPVFLKKDAYNLIWGPELANNGMGLRASLKRPFDISISTAVSYDFSGKIAKSNLGYEVYHLFDKPMTLGLELFKNEDIDSGQEDLEGGKIYLRTDLWPASYGLGQINDHITLYLVRNQEFEKSYITTARDDIEHTSYLKKREAIIGVSFNLDRSGPYPDPVTGYRLAIMAESAGHFLGATKAFNRASIEAINYFSTLPRQKLATRLKLGLGAPSDKNLFYLGSDEGLRGYERKELRGSRMILGNIEYRFPLKRDINYRFFDNIVNFKQLDGVLFFDIGQSWYDSFSNSDLKKDAGIGLRLHINIGEFLEKVILRLDVARAINEPDEDTHIWFGVSHSF
jgi:hypothetical protein